MIDFEKLKIAFELVEDHARESGESSTLTVIYHGFSAGEYYCWNSYSFGEFSCQELDEMIAKIEELTQPKFTIGQRVWFANGNQIESFLIQDITGDPWKLWSDNTCISEGSCYASKEELIDAQIKHWQKIRCTCLGHAYEGGSYVCMYCDFKNTYKCNQESVVSMAPRFEGHIKSFDKCETCDKYMMDCEDNCKCPDKLIQCNDHSEHDLEKVCEHTWNTSIICAKCGDYLG